MEKPRIVLCNKIDVEGAFDRAVEVQEKIKASEPDTVVIPVSVHTGRGMKDAQHQIMELVSRQEKRDASAATAGAGDTSENQNQFGSSFMKDRAYIDDDDDIVQYPGSEA
jgi:GTP-binding protein